MNYTKMAGKIDLTMQLQLLLSMVETNKKIVIDYPFTELEIVEVGETETEFVIGIGFKQ